jgi:hypothetical protein
MHTHTLFGCFAISFALALAPPPAAAQSAALVSQTIWGTPGHESTQGLAVGPEGSTYVTGVHNISGPLQIFLVKFAPDGSIAWQQTWDGPDQFFDNVATDVAVSPDGAAVYVTGTSFINPNAGVLLKFSAQDGSLAWDKSFGGNASPQGVAVASDGSIFVGGTVRLPDSSHMFVTKFDSEGSVLWHRLWNTPGAAVSTSGDDVAVDTVGNVYAVGNVPLMDPENPGFVLAFQIALLKIDTGGTLLWQRSLREGEQLDSRGGLTVGPDGSIYIAGARLNEKQFAFDALAVKFDAQGTLLWNRVWGGRGHDEAGAVAVRPDGAVFVAGTTNTSSNTDDVFYLQLEPDSGRGADAARWGNVETATDRADALAISSIGDVVIGATVQDPPYTYDRAPTRTARIRTFVEDPGLPLAAVDMTAVDAGGVVAPVAGNTNDDPGFDAAIVVLRP